VQLSTVYVENCTRRALAVEKCTRRASGRGRRVHFSTPAGPNGPNGQSRTGNAQTGKPQTGKPQTDLKAVGR
jgi:hypothetical protein